MSFVATFAWVRTNIRREPDHLNYLLSPHKTVERGSKVSMIIKVLIMGWPLSCLPVFGKENRGGPIQATFLLPPIIGGNKESASENVLSVRESL